MKLPLTNNKNRKSIYIILGLILLIALVLILTTIFDIGMSYDRTLRKAVSKKDPLVCEQMTRHVTYEDYSITREDSISLCKAEYAILTKDLEYCMTLKETPDTYEARPGVFMDKGIAQRDICLEGLAHELKRPDLCELLNTAKDPDYGEDYVKSCKAQALDPNYKPVRKKDSIPEFDNL